MTNWLSFTHKWLQRNQVSEAWWWLHVDWRQAQVLPPANIKVLPRKKMFPHEMWKSTAECIIAQWLGIPSRQKSQTSKLRMRYKEDFKVISILHIISAPYFSEFCSFCFSILHIKNLFFAADKMIQLIFFTIANIVLVQNKTYFSCQPSGKTQLMKSYA